MRIFIDSNIVISAILFPDGKVAKVFSHLLESHTVIISSYTKEECKKVFENKFPFKKELLGIFFDGITFEEFKNPDTIDEPLIFTPSKYFELIAEKYGYI